MKFVDLQPKLSAPTLEAIKSFGFVHATPVQAAAIPLFLQNKDVCVDATTGSGKTLAFGIPIFEMLSKQSPPLGSHDVGAMVLSPTRELAVQIFDVLSTLSTFHSTLKCVLLVGGTSVSVDAAQYTSTGGQVLIATPGRILDMKTRLGEAIHWKRLEVLVLDEADKLLDMGFKDAVNQILSFLPKQRRTGLFSATQTKEVKELARAGLRNPVIVAVTVQHAQPTSGASSAPAVNQVVPTTLNNWYLLREYDERMSELVQFILTHLDQKIIVFCATCACVDYYSAVFHQITSSYPNVLPNNLAIVGFHGKMVPKKRTLSYRKFKALPAGVMFSTDVAARGIDIPDVDWIVQLTAPKDPAFFVHRVGRTARAGRSGQALLFLTKEEAPYIDLLRGRGVPLQNADDAVQGADVINHHDIDYGVDRAAYGSNKVAYKDCYDILNVMKTISRADRSLLEMSSAAFVAFIRAYTEHLCSYIFRLAELDIGAVARSYALLRLPKIAETRGVKGKPIVFDTDSTNTSGIAYKNGAREQARQKKLETARAEEEAAEAEEQRLAAGGSISEDEAGSDDVAGDGDSDDSDASEKAPTVRTARTNRTGRTNRSGAVKAAWIPAEQYKQLLSEKTGKDAKGRHVTTADGELVTEKRQRKRKQSFVQKFSAEWDALADEEAIYQKFKKGKMSKEEYESKLTAMAELEDDEGDDDDDAPVSRKGRAKPAGPAKKVDYRKKKPLRGGR